MRTAEIISADHRNPMTVEADSNAAGRENPLTERALSVDYAALGFQSSSMVERAAVNRDVVGSSPTSGAIFYALVQQGLRRKRGAFF